MLKPYPYRPTGGINSEDCEDQLGETEVRDSANILYERKQFMTRPFAGAVTPVGFTGNIDFGKSIRLDVAPIIALISSNGKIYSRVNQIVATEITGGGTTLGSKLFHSISAVNGVFVFANNSAGMLRWDTSGFVYTVIAASNYRYVTSHLFRAVGAYKLDGAAGDARRVAWSQSGDETLWTGGDSGNTNLIDAPDDITGLEVLKNVLVVCRREGFHLGFATGISQPVYRFETWGRQAHGVQYPSTVDVMDNKLFYCSQEDVYIYDLQNTIPIGGKIRGELFPFLRAGVGYRGYCSKNVGDLPRLRYNLVPMANTASYPHFVYDFQDGAWSKHTYGNVLIRGGFYALQSQNFEGTALFTGGAIVYWDDNNAAGCEVPGFLVGRVITLEADEVDCIVRSLLLGYRNHGASSVKTTVAASLNNTDISTTDVQQIGVLPANSRLLRTWFRHQTTGQKFEIRLDIPTGKRFSGNYIGLQYDRSSEFKGDPGP